MSGRSYDFSKLDGRVETYDWEDHHSPALHILFEACESIHQFLLSKSSFTLTFFSFSNAGRVLESLIFMVFITILILRLNPLDILKHLS